MAVNKIVCAALLLEDNSVISSPVPDRHCDLFHIHHHTKKNIKVIDQGFLDSNNKFVNRKEAWKIAGSANQLINQQHNTTAGVLYTEDLW